MNRLHPLSAVLFAIQRGVVGLSAGFFGVVALSSVVEFVDGGWAFALAPIGFVAGAAYGVTYYYRFEYRVTGDTFDVSSGVFSRRSREIPYRRIQNVDVKQGVLHRLVGLAVVSVETAGGGDTEATLDFVSESEASRLQREIRRRTAESKRSGERNHRRKPGADQRPGEAPEMEANWRSAKESTPNNAPGTPIGPDRNGSPPRPQSTPKTPGEGERGHEGSPGSSPTRCSSREPVTDVGPGAYPVDEERPTPLFSLKSKELLLYSFTSFRPAAGAAVLFVLFFATDQIVDYLLAVSRPVGGPQDLGTGSVGSYTILSIVSFVNVVVVTYVVSAAYTFATYFGFTLSRAGGDFVYDRGLLQRYSGSIPVEKVQSVTVTANPVQRLIDYTGLWVETAGYGPDSDGGSQSAVPLARKGRVYGFTERLTDVETPRFRSPPPLARRRYLARYSILASTFVALFFGLSLVTALDRWYLTVVVFLAVPPAAHLRYVHLGFYVGTDHLVIRRGFWKRRTTVIPYYRIQTTSNRRSIFQRRLGLASLVVDTASSRTMFWKTPTIYDLDLETTREVHDTARERLQSAIREARADDAGFSVDFT